ncbi:MAG: TspO/MBR family protein [Acidobacteriota bacterium]
MKKSHALLGLAGFTAAVGAAAWFGSRFNPSIPKTALWYRSLNKPPWNPPNAVFPVVWTGIYALMAASGWRAWTRPASPRRQTALLLWSAQLVANAQWTWLFFGLQKPEAALIDIAVLEALIVSYMATTRKLDPAAAACFVPYAAWVAFAAVLNAEIVRRNP